MYKLNVERTKLILLGRTKCSNCETECMGQWCPGNTLDMEDVIVSFTNKYGVLSCFRHMRDNIANKHHHDFPISWRTFRKVTSEYMPEENVSMPVEPAEWRPRRFFTLDMYPGFTFDTEDDLPF